MVLEVWTARPRFRSVPEWAGEREGLAAEIRPEPLVLCPSHAGGGGFRRGRSRERGVCVGGMSGSVGGRE